jgi:hypothetical protein
VRDFLIVVSFLLLASSVQAQEADAPKIEPTPRWDPDIVKSYLEKRSADMATDVPADPVLAAPEPPKVISLPQPARQKTYLDGMEPNQVLAKLGKPSLDRRDGRVRMLQFTGKTCILDVLFWRAPINPQPGPQHVEARTLKGGKTDTDFCLQKQLAARGISMPRTTVPVPPPVVSPPAASPTPPAPPGPVPELKTEPLPPPVQTVTPADSAPKPPLPAPGLSYPLGGPAPPK